MGVRVAPSNSSSTALRSGSSRELSKSSSCVQIDSLVPRLIWPAKTLSSSRYEEEEDANALVSLSQRVRKKAALLDR